VNLRALIYYTLYRRFFRSRKPSDKYRQYVDLFCMLHPDLCADLDAGRCPFCGFQSKRRVVLANHMFRYSPDCGSQFNAVIEKFSDLFIAALNTAARKSLSNSMQYKCSICGYRSKRRIDVLRHIFSEHLPLLEGNTL